jgi:hypothetical protein
LSIENFKAMLQVKQKRRANKLQRSRLSLAAKRPFHYLKLISKPDFSALDTTDLLLLFMKLDNAHFTHTHTHNAEKHKQTKESSPFS